jgi:hypothetical protein
MLPQRETIERVYQIGFGVLRRQFDAERIPIRIMTAMIFALDALQ